jgi:hypothetical protein
MRVKNDSAFNLFQIIAGYPRWVTNDTRVNGKRFDLSNGEISKGVFSIVNITNGNYALVIDGNNNNNLGIGTESPGSRLVVKGVSTTSANSALNVTNSSDNSLLFVRNDGNVGIGNSTPTFKLDVTGTGNYTGALTATSSITGAAITLTGTTGYGFISDANSFRRIWFENEGLNRTLFDLRSSGTNFSFRKNTGTIIAIIDSLGNGLFTGSVSANSLSLTTPLSVANGGTGATSFSPNNYLIRTNSSGIFDTSAIYEAGGNVGIGTTSPKAKLNIFGSVGSGSLTIQQDLVHIGGNELGGDGGYAGIRLAGSSSTSYGVYIRGVKTNIFGGYWNSALTFNVTRTSEETIIDEVMRITSGSEVNIGYGTTDNGAYRLQVKDSVYVGGNVSAAAYTTRSDYNLKDDIYNLKYGLNDILQLQPVEYTYKSNGSKQLGFIAQDIGTILPEVVSFEESMTVNYQAIIPILTKAIQEQQVLIKSLEQRIINLENK